MWIILVAITAYTAWRYSKTTIDPDWALFNMPGFTGAQYGRDFVDCKTPAVHYWYWALAKMVGRSVPRVKFVHHFIVGMGGLALYAVTGNFYAGLAFTVLVNSPWLLAFHGNVGQVPAVLIAISLAANDAIVSPLLFVLAVLYEPKLIVAFIPAVMIYGWWWTLSGVVVIIPLYLVLRDKEWFKLILESSVTIPKRISDMRHGAYPWVPWFTASGLLYFLPWITLAAVSRPDVLFWIPPVAFALLTGYGGVIRQNHIIPLVAWVALAGIPGWFVVMLAAVDFIAGGLYLGDIWWRHYVALRDANEEAKTAGEWLRNREGALWVHGIHTAVYIWAQKPPTYGMTDQIEIREVAFERRREMVRRWQANPPDYITITMQPGTKLDPTGYRMIATIGGTHIGAKKT